MATWPATLPPPVRDGYGLEPADATARTDMDAGPARVRLRYTATPTMVPARWIITELEFAIFEAWYHQQIADGAAWFTGPVRNGQGLSDQDCRFVGPWKATQQDGHYVVTATLEVRARPLMTPAQLAPYL